MKISRNDPSLAHGAAARRIDDLIRRIQRHNEKMSNRVVSPKPGVMRRERLAQLQPYVLWHIPRRPNGDRASWSTATLVATIDGQSLGVGVETFHRDWWPDFEPLRLTRHAVARIMQRQLQEDDLLGVAQVLAPLTKLIVASGRQVPGRGVAVCGPLGALIGRVGDDGWIEAKTWYDPDTAWDPRIKEKKFKLVLDDGFKTES